MGEKKWISALQATIRKLQGVHVLAFLAVTLFVAIFVIFFWAFDNTTFQTGIGTWNPRDSSNNRLALNPHPKFNNISPYNIEGTSGSGDEIVKFKWISNPSIENVTETLLKRLAENGTKACHNVKTVRVDIIGLLNSKPVVLAAGVIHDFIMVATDENGQKRCAGGDYYETDLSGPSWKSRPPVVDLGNGTYSLRLQMEPRFAGLYVFKVILLFGNFNGMRRRSNRWVRQEELMSLQIKFEDSKLASRLKICSDQDFKLNAWSGRWTRHYYNKSCDLNREGRFKCLNPEEQCPEPWCHGAVGALESNGWVYSAHCGFKIFGQDEAWKCLDGRWLFFWGDSNHVDSIRNLLNFVLGIWDINSVPRRFDETFLHPKNISRSVRITSMFNGHSNDTMNYEGLHSLQDIKFRKKLHSFFVGDQVPDTMIMNSGLHDGVYWKSLPDFVDAADKAVDFWNSVVQGVVSKGKKKPIFVYRNTIATGGQARALSFNPHKMDIFNQILLEKLKKRSLPSYIVDNFDLTYPWHYDNNCSDGVHYGRRPARARWYGQIGHQYFVDLMLIHILLNAICGRK